MWPKQEFRPMKAPATMFGKNLRGFNETFSGNKGQHIQLVNTGLKKRRSIYFLSQSKNMREKKSTGHNA